MENFDISTFCKTKNEASDFLESLLKVSKEIYETKFNLDSALSDNLGMNKKEKFLNLLRDNNINPGDNSALEGFIEKLQEKIKSLPVVSLSIAFEPDAKTLETISEWFLLNAKKEVLLDIVIDVRIVGGVTIYYNGKFKDYSIQPKIQSIISNRLQNSQVNTIYSKAGTPEPKINEHFSLGR